MNILEQEIEGVVWNAIVNERELLKETGFPVRMEYTYFRQLDLNGYGRPDIMGFRVGGCRGDRTIYVDVIELKKDEVNVGTLLQAVKYATGIRELVRYEGYENYDVFCEFHLIGKSIERGSTFIYLPDHISKIHLYTYSIDLRTGIRFQSRNNYILSDPSFQKGSKKLFPIFKANIRQNYHPGQDDEDLEF